MNIILLFPKHRQDYYSPTNLVMLGTITEKLGHTVKIVDLNYDKLPKEKFDIVGVTGQSSWKNQIIEVANSFPNSTVIVGGSWASLYPEEALSHKNIKHVVVALLLIKDSYIEKMKKFNYWRKQKKLWRNSK